MMADPQEFLQVVRPALESGDATTLAQTIRQRWTARQICPLLRYPDVDVRRVASMTLGLIGERACVNALARALHDSDEQVNQMAEHSLWAIWFRSSTPEAARPFREGVALLSADANEQAIDKLLEAVRVDPDFAEAYNQCAIARFFLGQWRDAAEDCRQTILRMPCHFGAMAGMGHCYTHLGDLSKALECYQKAVAINPAMPAINRAIDRLKAKLSGETEGKVVVKQQQPASKGSSSRRPLS